MRRRLSRLGAQRQRRCVIANPSQRFWPNGLPSTGLVLEIASGNRRACRLFRGALCRPRLAAQRCRSRRTYIRLPRGVRHPDSGTSALQVALDSADPVWPIDRADAVLSINMVHISPWQSALGLLGGAARILATGAPLILYGPWLADDIELRTSNLAFDSEPQAARSRDGACGVSRILRPPEKNGGFTLKKRARCLPTIRCCCCDVEARRRLAVAPDVAVPAGRPSVRPPDRRG